MRKFLSVKRPLSLCFCRFGFFRPETRRRGRVLQATNVRSLGEGKQNKTKVKFGAPFLLQWLIYRQRKHPSDSRVTELLSRTANDWSSPIPSAWRTTRFENGDNKRRGFIIIIIITITVISCFLEKKDNKHWQRYNHALTDPGKREMAGQRRVRLSDTLGLSREQTI